MQFYDLHPPAGTPGGPWPFSSITKLVAHPSFPAQRSAIEKARAKYGYPVMVKGWRIEQRQMNPSVLLL